MPHFISTRKGVSLLIVCLWGALLLLASCRSHVPTARETALPPTPPSPRQETAPPPEKVDTGPVNEIPPPEPRRPAALRRPSLLPPLPITPLEDWLIVVQKGKRKLLVYRDCQMVKTFPIDLGDNPKGPKLYQGDMRTPEGLYRVIEKKDRGRTKYHLALLLDYPNERDRIRFEAAVKAGQVPNGNGIGSLIEIHGEGRGEDWTQGCIALHNHHMGELFKHVPLGTPVWIDP